jgi:hypothetical protein
MKENFVTPAESDSAGNGRRGAPIGLGSAGDETVAGACAKTMVVVAQSPARTM